MKSCPPIARAGALRRLLRGRTALLCLGLLRCGADGASVGRCPDAAVEFGGTCRPSCEGERQCGASERCDVAVGACVPRSGGEPRIERFDFEPAPAVTGAAVVLRYRVRDAARVEISRGALPETDQTEGEFLLTAPDRDVEYVLTAHGADARGQPVAVRMRRMLRVAEGRVRIDAFSVVPEIVEAGQPVEVRWDVRHATGPVALRIDGRLVHRSEEGAGRYRFRPSHPAMLTLTAPGPHGPAEAAAWVIMEDTPAPTVEAVDWIAPTHPLREGDAGYLSWRTTGATEVAIYEGASDEPVARYGPERAAAGRTLLAPTASTRYRVEARFGPRGARAPVEIQVEPRIRPPEIERFDWSHRTFRYEAPPEVLGHWRVGGLPDEVTLVVGQAAPVVVSPEVEQHRIRYGGHAVDFVLRAVSEAGQVEARGFVRPIQAAGVASERAPVALDAHAVQGTLPPDVARWFRIDVPASGGLRMGFDDDCPSDVVVRVRGPWSSGETPPAIHSVSTNLGCPSDAPTTEVSGLEAGTYLLSLTRVAPREVPFVFWAVAEAPRCGDGALDAGEACDDGNRAARDGCSPECAFEPAFHYEVALTEADRLPAPEGQPLALSWRAAGGGAGQDVAFVALPEAAPLRLGDRRFSGFEIFRDGVLSFYPTARHPGAPLASDATEESAWISALGADLVVDEAAAVEARQLDEGGIQIDFRGLRVRGEAARVTARIDVRADGAITLRYGAVPATLGMGTVGLRLPWGQTLYAPGCEGGACALATAARPFSVVSFRPGG